MGLPHAGNMAKTATQNLPYRLYLFCLFFICFFFYFMSENVGFLKEIKI